MLSVDDYHVEGSKRWKSAPMKSSGSTARLENYPEYLLQDIGKVNQLQDRRPLIARTVSIIHNKIITETSCMTIPPNLAQG
jgi:hypothetical protein